MKKPLSILGIIAALFALLYQAMRFVFDYFTLRAGDTRDYTWPMAVSVTAMAATLLFGLYFLHGLISKQPTTNNWQPTTNNQQPKNMQFTRLVPSIFYEDITVGLDLFINCLGFTMAYNGLAEREPCCVVDRDSLSVFLFQNKEYADKDRPEIRLQTPDIEAVYKQVSSTHPHLLHPNLNTVTMRPWGALEFALADKSGVGIRVQQW